VNGQAVPDDASLTRQAREALSRDADLRAVIQADGAVTHRRLMGVLDALKAAGVSRIAFGALPPEASAHE
jgi:biopolymer transport protein ExbD